MNTVLFAAEKSYFDALAQTVLPTTDVRLIVFRDGQSIQLIQPQGVDFQNFQVLETRRTDGELPWLLTRSRLYIVADQGRRRLAFDIPHALLNVTSDLDAMVQGALSLQSGEVTYFFFNGMKSCWVYRLEAYEMLPVVELTAHVYGACEHAGRAHAVGEKFQEIDGKIQTTPLLWDLSGGREFEHEGLDLPVRQQVQASAAEQLPAGYRTDRLHVDAFVGCEARSDGKVLLLAVISEAVFPQDLDWDDSSRGSAPCLSDCIGLAYFEFDGEVLSLARVDLHSRLAEVSVQASGCQVYLLKGKKAGTPTLSSLYRQPFAQAALGDVEVQKLHFVGVPSDTALNRFKISGRTNGAYLATVNVGYGFNAGKFAPEDYVFTSNDGLTWLFAGSTKDLTPLLVPLAA